jgi:hypothetical protein
VNNDENFDDAIPGSELPKLDFSTFVMSIIGSAYVHLGDAPDPESGEMRKGGGETEPNLILAHQDIELLELLGEKTKGNLTGDEERVLEQGLHDLRMRFLEVKKGK